MGQLSDATWSPAGVQKRDLVRRDLVSDVLRRRLNSTKAK